MLFDLRGRGRRRAIQVIYASLALLMGGGLIFFGIGGNTSGGLFDAFKGGSTLSNQQAFKKRLDGLDRRVRLNPKDAQAWADLAALRFQVATTGDGYDQVNQVYTDKGKAELRQAETAWDRYLALNPKPADDKVANQMIRAFGPAGLKAYDKAVGAMEIVIDSRPPSAALYANLAILAHAAKQDRKSTLAQGKAEDLAKSSAERKQITQSIQGAEAQIDAQATQTRGTATTPTTG
jgi:tetratricopeptide (TPR) repeat protein